MATEPACTALGALLVGTLFRRPKRGRGDRGARRAIGPGGMKKATTEASAPRAYFVCASCAAENLPFHDLWKETRSRNPKAIRCTEVKTRQKGSYSWQSYPTPALGRVFGAFTQTSTHPVTGPLGLSRSSSSGRPFRARRRLPPARCRLLAGAGSGPARDLAPSQKYQW